jgi:hypothetical protein
VLRKLYGLYFESRLRMHIFVYFSKGFTELLRTVDVKYLSQVYLHCFRLEMQLSLSLFLSLSLSRYSERLSCISRRKQCKYTCDINSATGC